MQFIYLPLEKSKVLTILHRSVNRQCINFDKLTAWRKENTLDPAKYEKIMKKSSHPGVKERHQSDAYYEYFHKENPNHINGANPGEDFNM